MTQKRIYQNAEHGHKKGPGKIDGKRVVITRTAENVVWYRALTLKERLQGAVAYLNSLRKPKAAPEPAPEPKAPRAPRVRKPKVDPVPEANTAPASEPEADVSFDMPGPLEAAGIETQS